MVGQCCYGNPSSPSCADELETNCVARPDFISWDRYLDCTTPCPNPPEGRCCYGDPYMPSCINETESECLGRGDYISWNEYYDCSIPCPPASIDTANMIFTAFCPQAVRENILVSSDFAIGIKIDNTIPLPTYDWCGGGFSFKFYSPDHSITNITHRSVSGGAGSTQSIEYLNNFSSMFNIGIFISEFSWDGSLPDSINFQVIGFDCMPPALPDQEYIRFHLTTDQEGIFCIDSLEFDNSTYNWLFGDPFTASFNGPF